MKRKLHICHFSSVHGTHDTRVFYRECVTLATEHRVTYIGIGIKSGTENGVEIIALPKSESRLQRIFHTTFKVYRLAKNQNADVYHFHDPELIPFAYLLKRQGKQVIYDIHENVTESMKAKNWLPFKFFFIRLYLLFDKLAAKHFHLILAENSYEAVYKKRYPNKQTITVRNFAPAELLAPYRNTQRSKNPLNIFYMGSIDELYCIEPMLKSIYVLKQRGHVPQLKLVGWVQPTLLARLKQLSYWKEIENNVTFFGYRDVKNGYELSQDCMLGYSFVSDNVNVKESFPRKMYEYMQVGLPVISSGFPLYRQVVEHHQTGICIDECTAENIANAVEQLLSDKDLIDKISQQSISAAEEYFSWEGESKRLLGLYEGF